MPKHYQKKVIYADDGRRRVIVEIQCIDDVATLVPDEFEKFHKSAADGIISSLCNTKHFYPHLSDIRARNKR